MKKASITIFLTFLLLFFMCFIFSFLEAARISSLKGKTELISQVSMQSLGGNYHKKLWEDYHLLFLDGGFGTDMFSTEKLAEKGIEEGNYNLVLSQKGAWDFTECTLDTVEVVSYQLATDGGGAAFRHQVSHQMKYETQESQLEDFKKLREYAEAMKKKIDFPSNGKSITEIDLWKWKLEDIWKQAWESSLELERLKKQQEENPMKSAKKWKSQDILSLTLGNLQKISSSKIPIRHTLSLRQLSEGTVPIRGREDENTRLFMHLFLEKNYDCFLGKEKGDEEEGLSYEMEYLLVGKSSDKENLKQVITTLLDLRTFFHYQEIQLHWKGQEIAYKMAENEVEKVKEVVQNRDHMIESLQKGILLSFAYEEAVLEIRELLSGGKIPWEKSLEQWQCKFLQNVGSFTEEKTVQEGFSYKEYLQILLFFLSDTTMNYRSMDILENKYQIHMDTMLQASTMRFQYYGKPLFWNFNFLKEKNWSIFQFPVEVSFSYCK